MPSGILFLVPYQGFVDRFFRVVFRDQLLVSSSDKACGCFVPARSFVFFPFFGSEGGDFFISLIIFLSIPIRVATCLPILRLRLDGNKCVASPCSDIDMRHPFHLALPPLPDSSRFACFDLFPRPPGRGMSGLMPICRCWLRVGLLACHRPHAALSLIARSLFLIGLRAGALSVCGCLLRFLRHRGRRMSSLLFSARRLCFCLSSWPSCHLVFDTG